MNELPNEPVPWGCITFLICATVIWIVWFLVTQGIWS